jgi:hypothetical protein
MNTRHTPGPWELQAGRTFKTQSGEFFLSYGKCPKTGKPDFSNFCELDANARLIASAPDLLAMLERVTAFLNDPNGDEFGATALDSDIRALIAQVKVIV